VGVIPEDWEFTTVGQLVRDNVIQTPLDGNHGDTHPKSGDFVTYGIPFVMANNVHGGTVDLSNCSFIRKEQADSLRKGFSVPGDVLLTHKATIGNTAVVGAIPFEYIMLTPQVTYYRVADRSRLNNRYLRHFFDSTQFQQVLLALSGGGTRAYIGITAQLQLPVAVPPFPEQEAIAVVLSDADALIESLEQLIAKKRRIKLGAMQELLTGKRRLPGFGELRRQNSEVGEIPIDWRVLEIGVIANVKTGPFGSSLHERDYVDDGTPIITVEHLGERGVLHADLPMVSEADRKRLAAYSLEEGDIVFSRVGSVDRNARISKAEHGWLFSGRLLRVRPFDESTDTNYLSYHFHFEPFKQRVRTVAVGQTMACLNTRILKSVLIVLPEPHEQAAIAAVLSDMDAEIAALEGKLAKARQIKQGMMHNLLTGRIRLV
jgi:type I restriction enzyme S subunit